MAASACSRAGNQHATTVTLRRHGGLPERSGAAVLPRALCRGLPARARRLRHVGARRRADRAERGGRPEGAAAGRRGDAGRHQPASRCASDHERHRRSVSTLAVAVAREAGEVARKAYRASPRRARTFKGPQDYVLESDARGRAHDPRARCWRRSRTTRSSARKAAATFGRDVWVVDPIDGTANFARGIPHWCISIAFVRDMTDRDRRDLSAADRRDVCGPARRRRDAERQDHEGQRRSPTSARP